MKKTYNHPVTTEIRFSSNDLMALTNQSSAPPSFGMPAANRAWNTLRSKF